jgi:hypothetical protein
MFPEVTVARTITVASRRLQLAAAICLLLGAVSCRGGGSSVPEPSAEEEWKVTWSAPGQDISEWHSIQVRKNTKDRIQSLEAPPGGTDRAFRFAVGNNDVAVNNSCGDVPSGWRAEGLGPTEQVSNRPIRYEWNNWFERSFPGNPATGGQPIWVVFTQWHQRDASTGKSPPIEFIVEDGWLRLGLNHVDPVNPTESVREGPYNLAPFKAEVWHHWRAEIVWSPKNGSVKVWHDGNVVQDLRQVQTVFPVSSLQVGRPGDSYLKVGVYRKPVMSTEPWVVWHDEFKRLEQGNASPLPHPLGKLPMCLSPAETPSIG